MDRQLCDPASRADRTTCPGRLPGSPAADTLEAGADRPQPAGGPPACFRRRPPVRLLVVFFIARYLRGSRSRADSESLPPRSPPRMNVTSADLDAEVPFRFGTPEEFRAVRELLAASGYSSAGVAERMGIEAVHEHVTIRQGRAHAVETHDALDALIRLFLDGEAVGRERLTELLAPGGPAALDALGLLAAHPADPGSWGATVLLYPVFDIYVASDLREEAPGASPTGGELATDHVYPALTPNTHTFLRMLPRAVEGRFLELCAGTGIAALLAAPTAGRAWAVDITPRSTRFAEFNTRLNSAPNVEALCGDLYEPVRDQSFETIVAHPPYIPAVDQPLIFAHAGEDGEEVLRRIVAGVPRHLAPGGRFYCTCRSTDRAGKPLEARLREMLGPAEGDFDVLVVTHYGFHPTEYYSRLAAVGRVTFSFLEERHRMYRRHEVERLVYCSIVIQRHEAPRPAFTLRRERGDHAWSPEVEWLLAWETDVRTGRADELCLAGRPVLSPAARLEVTHRVQGGEWAQDAATLRVDRPFPRSLASSTNVALMLAVFDGSVTGREALSRLRAAGVLPPEVPDAAFAELLRQLVTEGVLHLDRG
jgi:SAM-dependent methyltransferase